MNPSAGSMNELSFLIGYLEKSAADPEYDLPSGSWYKGLLPELGKHQSGRAQAAAEAQGKKAPWLTRHPYWGDILGASGGAAAGTLAGMGIGGAVGGEKGAVIGGLGGGVGSGIAAIIALALIRQKQTKTISKEFVKPDPYQLRKALDRIAERGFLGTGAKGVITGSYDLGRASQLANLASKKPKEVKSGYAAGALPIATGAVGAASQAAGVPFVGAGLGSLINAILALKGRDIAGTESRRITQEEALAKA